MTEIEPKTHVQQEEQPWNIRFPQFFREAELVSQTFPQEATMMQKALEQIHECMMDGFGACEDTKTGAFFPLQGFDVGLLAHKLGILDNKDMEKYEEREQEGRRIKIISPGWSSRHDAGGLVGVSAIIEDELIRSLQEIKRRKESGLPISQECIMAMGAPYSPGGKVTEEFLLEFREKGFKAYTRILDDVLETSGLIQDGKFGTNDNVIFLGYSRGTVAMAEFAAAHPEIHKTLFMIAPTGFRFPQLDDTQRAAQMMLGVTIEGLMGRQHTAIEKDVYQQMAERVEHDEQFFSDSKEQIGLKKSLIREEARVLAEGIDFSHLGIENTRAMIVHTTGDALTDDPRVKANTLGKVEVALHLLRAVSGATPVGRGLGVAVVGLRKVKDVLKNGANPRTLMPKYQDLLQLGVLLAGLLEAELVIPAAAVISLFLAGKSMVEILQKTGIEEREFRESPFPQDEMRGVTVFHLHKLAGGGHTHGYTADSVVVKRLQRLRNVVTREMGERRRNTPIEPSAE